LKGGRIPVGEKPEGDEDQGDEAQGEKDVGAENDELKKPKKRKNKKKKVVAEGAEGEVKEGEAKQPKVIREKGPPSKTDLWVGKLPAGFTTDDVKGLFHDYRIKSVKRIKWFALVKCEDEEEQAKILSEIGAVEVNGHTVKIKPSHELLQPKAQEAAEAAVDANVEA
jgi:hypothetical protein